jgi:hypothetical protein
MKVHVLKYASLEQTSHSWLQGEGLAENFIEWVEVARISDCWNWLRHPHRKYGVWGRTPVHRWVFETLFGYLESRLIVVDHLCENTRCVNPLHLEAIPQRENLRRAWAGRKPHEAVPKLEIKWGKPRAIKLIPEIVGAPRTSDERRKPGFFWWRNKWRPLQQA